MATEEEDISEKIDHLFRHEYGKLVAVLTKTFGTSNIELAEDVVQEAMMEALSQWTYSGEPENPVGWIYKVAKYKAVNIVNREQIRKQHSTEVALQVESQSTLELPFSEKEIVDDQLGMIFTCCHPCISSDSQVALTLKTLCGFSIPEIARAFLTNEENINKRLVRARKSIREANISFEVPTGKLLSDRINSVLEVIYLVFNEGYHASSGELAIRYELCEEAIRLAKLLLHNEKIEFNSEVSALLALMSLNASRFSARLDESNDIVDLEHQDRSKWNKHMINTGLSYLSFSAKDTLITSYHILATISAHHCAASSFETTDWLSILELYNNLLKLDPSPVVELNRAVALAQMGKVEEGIKVVQYLDEGASLRSYLPYYTVSAELYRQTCQYEKASGLLKKALELAPNDKVKQQIHRKIGRIQSP